MAVAEAESLTPNRDGSNRQTYVNHRRKSGGKTKP